MSRRKILTLTLSVLAIGVLAGPAMAQAREFEGTVTAKDADARTFTLLQDEGAGSVTIQVTPTTKFQRIQGFDALQVGARNIEARAFKDASGNWVATKVERSGRSGSGGGTSGGGADDGPNHT